MPKAHQGPLLILARKMVLSFAAILLALMLGSPLGVLLLFYYVYLLAFRWKKLQEVYNRVGDTQIGLVRLWDWMKKTVKELTRGG